MSSDLSTSTMNSPPLEVWFTGSLGGAVVSTAMSFGPGTAAFRGGRGAAVWAFAAAGVSAAAPVSAAPLRKLRRLETERSSVFLGIGVAPYGMIPKMPAPDLIRGGYRSSEKIMPHQVRRARCGRGSIGPR